MIHALAAIVPIATVVACSLGLDEGLIGAQQDGGASEGGPIDEGGSGDAGGDGATDGAHQQTGACSKDTDCKSALKCVTGGHCDPIVHVCSYDVCVQSMACNAAVCDSTGNSCSVPTTYGFHASSFKVTSGGVGCGNANRCFAAAYPFVFVGTTSGVVAYNVADPSSSSPSAVPITGLPFVPAHVRGNGRRIFFVASPVGGGNNTHVAIAWLDVPGDPFAQSFNAQTVFLSYSQGSFNQAFPAANGALFLVSNDSSKAFPTALFAPPVPDGSGLGFFPSPGVAAGASVVGASGTRLVTSHWDGNAYMTSFSFENGAGTSNAQNAGEQTASAMGEVYAQGFTTSASDGSILWSAPVANTPDGGSFTETAARMTWLVADAKATTFDAGTHVDIETYSPPVYFGAPVAGPAAALDAKTAVVIAGAKEDPLRQVSVQIASRAQTPASIVPNKRYVLPVDVNAVGVATSNGFAYVLAADDPTNQTATVHVFAPGCQ
jgi:hypothetical protein